LHSLFPSLPLMPQVYWSSHTWLRCVFILPCTVFTRPLVHLDKRYLGNCYRLHKFGCLGSVWISLNQFWHPDNFENCLSWAEKLELRRGCRRQPFTLREKYLLASTLFLSCVLREQVIIAKLALPSPFLSL
jgi:hypothetical protein